jgi:phosphatidylglycerol:prolipoprotein diacylglycerol transferase
LIAQIFPSDSTKSVTIKKFYQNQVKSFNKIDVGASLGTYYNSLKYNPQAALCGTTYTSEDYKYVYRMGGAGFSNITKKGKSTTTIGLNLFGGINNEKDIGNQLEKTNFLFGINPYIKYDFNWVGMGAGVYLGNLKWVPLNPIDETSYYSGTRYSPILPEAYLRVGRRDILDLKYTYGFNFPTSLPLLFQDVSLGSGFGNKTEYSLRVGAAISKYYSYTFISAEGLVGKKIGLTFRYNFGNGNFYSGNNQVVYRPGRILFGANYRFGFKK